ncbi:MAG: hypothetical protein OXI53_07095 [Nitrospira sp.]|nr:hypothetical protein [Nitrospira sp.]MDE0405063.1 hypothetical protein [Nitrospira sp.]
MARFATLVTRVTDKYFLYFFVFGVICGTLLSVISGPSEYHRACDAAQRLTWQYLSDSHQIDTPAKRGLYEALCEANMRADGAISPSFKYLLTEEGKKELNAWLTEQGGHDTLNSALKDCTDVMDILFCEYENPTNEKIRFFLFSVSLFIAFAFLILAGENRDLLISGIGGLAMGWIIGWYIVGWLWAI